MPILQETPKNPDCTVYNTHGAGTPSRTMTISAKIDAKSAFSSPQDVFGGRNFDPLAELQRLRTEWEAELTRPEHPVHPSPPQPQPTTLYQARFDDSHPLEPLRAEAPTPLLKAEAPVLRFDDEVAQQPIAQPQPIIAQPPPVIQQHIDQPHVTQPHVIQQPVVQQSIIPQHVAPQPVIQQPVVQQPVIQKQIIRKIRKRPVLELFGWTLVAVGLVAVTIGSLVFLQRIVAGVPMVWTIEMPIALAGACICITGLALQIWRLTKMLEDATP